MENVREILVFKVLKIIDSQSYYKITKDKVNINFKKLGIDSLGMLNIIVMIEKLFHITIFDEEFEKFTNINDIINYIEKKVNKDPT
jgi:acyl carrier protein